MYIKTLLLFTTQNIGYRTGKKSKIKIVCIIFSNRKFELWHFRPLPTRKKQLQSYNWNFSFSFFHLTIFNVYFNWWIKCVKFSNIILIFYFFSFGNGINEDLDIFLIANDFFIFVLYVGNLALERYFLILYENKIIRRNY